MLAKTLLNTDERSQACKLFWSIYVLDRRWSFGTGMPFAIQDADIDPALPEPVRALCNLRQEVTRLTGSGRCNSILDSHDTVHSDIHQGMVHRGQFPSRWEKF